MNANREYKRIFHKNWNGIRSRKKELIRVADAAFHDQQLAEQKRRQPKARKKFQPLDEAFVEELRTRLLAEHAPEIERLGKLLDDAAERKKRRLAELAPHVVPEPDPLCWHRIRCSHSSSYRSQGWGKHKYAREALAPDGDALERCGLIVDIRKRVEFETPAVNPFWGVQPAETYWQFELWANCEPWVADACGRFLVLEYIASCDSNGVNPRVFLPFLETDTLQECRRILKEQKASLSA